MDVFAKTLEKISGLKLGVDFGLCIDQELQREAITIEQYFDLPQNVLGVSDARTARIMTKIYAQADGDVMVTSLSEAEMGALSGSLDQAMGFGPDNHSGTDLDALNHTDQEEKTGTKRKHTCRAVQSCAILGLQSSFRFKPLAHLLLLQQAVTPCGSVTMMADRRGNESGCSCVL